MNGSLGRSLFALCFLASPAAAQLGGQDGGARPQRVLYVDDDATGAGDGSSWQDAFVDLQAALSVAERGDQVWVAQGTYLPSAGGDRDASFHLVDGVQLYGGFRGDEPTLASRAGRFRRTILSGDLEGDDDRDFGNVADNSTHVIRAHGVGPGTRVDGFLVRGGDAISELEDGGGAEHRDASPVYAHCTFASNRGVLGGAVSNTGGAPEFLDCRFLGNLAHHGGAMASRASKLRAAKCLFRGNEALPPGRLLGEGSALLDEDGTEGLYVLCTFDRNFTRYRPQLGYHRQVSVIEVRGHSSFDTCSFLDHGYGRYLIRMSSPGEPAPAIRDCHFEGNFTDNSIYLASVEGAQVSRCTFRELYVESVVRGVMGSAAVSGCDIRETKILYGSLRFDPGFRPHVSRCIVQDNVTPDPGDLTFWTTGVFLTDGLVENTLIANNSGVVSGNLRAVNSLVRNCTIVNNGSDPAGFRPVTLAGGSRLENTIVRGHPGTEMAISSGIVAFSNVEGGVPTGADGGGNLDLDALFVGAAGGDFRHAAGSPCIDRGDPAFLPLLTKTDVYGGDRLLGGRVDVGADEFGN